MKQNLNLCERITSEKEYETIHGHGGTEGEHEKFFFRIVGLAQVRYRWRALVSSVMNLRVP
jgi:hypothetical protein